MRPGPFHVSPRVQWRIFLICWLVYLVHFSPFVTREQYLTMALAERGTVQVPEYVGMHSDLFTLPGRGSFVGTNPGAPYLAIVPYWLALPVINRVAPVRPRPPDPALDSQYLQERPNSMKFYQRARELGIDVRLGVGALVTSGFFMAPLTALSAVVMFRLFRWLSFSQSESLWMTLLYAFGTPVFLRAGTLSLNLLVALLNLAAFALIWWPGQSNPRQEKWRYFAAGALSGYGVATDYTGIVPLLAIGLFALVRQWESKPFAEACKGTLWTVAGTIGPGLFLLWYQWHCYGDPWLPVQFHQPKTIFAGYASAQGIGWPSPSTLWALLFDAQYGWLVFAPVFALALYHPVLVWKKESRVPSSVAVYAWINFVALWVFCSCIQYTARHQWQDGFRYLVPALPPLLLLVGDVILRGPRWVAWPLMGYSVFTSWCVAMVRHNPYESMLRVWQDGVQFPWLTTLGTVAMQYFPSLADPHSLWSRTLPMGILTCLFVGLGVVWHLTKPKELEL